MSPVSWKSLTFRVARDAVDAADGRDLAAEAVDREAQAFAASHEVGVRGGRRVVERQHLVREGGKHLAGRGPAAGEAAGVDLVDSACW